MKAIVPAAGIGKRLQPLTFFNPKPLLYVGKKRMIDYIMDSLLQLELSEIIVIAGYRGEMLEKYLTANYRQKFTFVYQREQSGLGDAVLTGIENSEIEDDDGLLVLLSDTITDADMKKFAKKGVSRLAVKEVANPSSFGIVETKDGMVTEMSEKPERPKSNLAITGLYYFSDTDAIRDSLVSVRDSGLRTKGEFQLTDAMKHMLERKFEFKAFPVRKWIDCGNFEMYIDSNRELLKRDSLKSYTGNAEVTDSKIAKNVSIFGKAKIINSKLKDCVIFPGSVIENSVLYDSVIGENCFIRNFKGSLICSDKTIIKK